MSAYRVVLADDHVMVRQGVKRILKEIPDLEVVGEVGDGLQLLDFLKKTPLDLVVLDISMPHLQGIEATKKIKARCPHIKILLLTMHKNKEYLYHAIAAGAEGYLLKEDADTELISAIATIRQGGSYISSLMSG
jgi:DNA-binding NarL/FixJ family response regulator